MEAIRQLLREARSIAVLTGAGVSAESGVPTFRGNNGLWRQYRAQDLATPEAFESNPKLVWEWYDWRRSLIAQARPNAAHLALAELEGQSRNFTLITQNVDDLHDDAGSRNVLKVHGSIWTVRCTECGWQHVDRRVPLADLPPKCKCGGVERPGVVWFGENLPTEIWDSAEQAASDAEVFLVIGTSAVVYPAAGLVQTARRSGAKVIEINLETTPVSGTVDRFLQGSAAELLPRLMA